MVRVTSETLVTSDSSKNSRSDTRENSRSSAVITTKESNKFCVGRGKTCPGTRHQGRTDLDLTKTQFQIPEWLKFQYRGGSTRNSHGLQISQKVGNESRGDFWMFLGYHLLQGKWN
ncbi:uncharacterized protein LOC142346247 [Convolutriloba macropyga]|uniref:uncharacterized protein LOC142346247 n=1 Tax=Convolutriloba macropyga TaxID=536237 RepID=UPI003F52655E